MSVLPHRSPLTGFSPVQAPDPAPAPPRSCTASARSPTSLASPTNPADTKRARATLATPALALTAQDVMKPHPPTAASAVGRNFRTIKHRKPCTDLLGFRKRDGNAEARIQAAIVAWVRLAAPELLIFHVPNGGFRTKAEAARLKWTGTVAGIPDLAIVTPGGRVHFLEVKSPTGRLSPDQISIRHLLIALGSAPAICRSIDDARRAFMAWGLTMTELPEARQQ